MLQILFQITKKFYGDFSDVAAGFWRGLFEPYAMSRMVSLQNVCDPSDSHSVQGSDISSYKGAGCEANDIHHLV